MKRVLFVSNGHGETEIAGRIAREARALGAVQPEHLPLVGTGGDSPGFPLAGPRAAMPSGGLVAMGNVGNLARDLRAGFAALLAAQTEFLRSEGRSYDAIVAVGDVYALSLALLAGRPVLYVGTAKSVYVAPYGPFERTLLRRARRVFVRDRATAERLRSEGVAAEAPGNVISDLGGELDPSLEPVIALLPGSRSQAYNDAVRLAATVRELAHLQGGARAVLSIAPALDAAIVARLLAEDGWAVVPAAGRPFIALAGRARVEGSRAALGPMLRASTIAIGQAGTANELAAALGVPVVALDRSDRGREDWYRMRQRKLLGDALRIVPGEPRLAAEAIHALLTDPDALRAMRAAGRERMGPPGGASAIAEAIADALAA